MDIRTRLASHKSKLLNTRGMEQETGKHTNISELFFPHDIFLRIYHALQSPPNKTQQCQQWTHSANQTIPSETQHLPQKHHEESLAARNKPWWIKIRRQTLTSRPQNPKSETKPSEFGWHWTMLDPSGTGPRPSSHQVLNGRKCLMKRSQHAIGQNRLRISQNRHIYI